LYPFLAFFTFSLQPALSLTSSQLPLGNIYTGVERHATVTLRNDNNLGGRYRWHDLDEPEFSVVGSERVLR
jgi:hypothetical protein